MPFGIRIKASKVEVTLELAALDNNVERMKARPE